MRPAVSRLFLALALIFSAAAILLVPLPNEYRAAWTTALMDLAHLPLFALLTFGFWRWLRCRLWQAFAVGSAISIAVEFCQPLISRTASVFDAVWGILGCALAALFILASGRPMSRKRIAITAVAAVALVAWPLVQTVPIVLDAYRAYRSFPVLCEFQTDLEVGRWQVAMASLDRVKYDRTSERWAGKVRFFPCNSGESSLVLFPVVADWTGYRRFCCELSVKGEPISLLVSIRDGEKVSKPLRRFDLLQRYEAGWHRISIDLDELARGGTFAPVHTSKVQSIHLVSYDRSETKTVYIHRVYLE